MIRLVARSCNSYPTESLDLQEEEAYPESERDERSVPTTMWRAALSSAEVEELDILAETLIRS